MKTTIRKYERLKLYQVDGSIENGELKSKVVPNEGRLKIYINDSFDRVYFMIYTFDENSKERQLYDELSLNEINIDIIETACRVELKKTAIENNDKEFSKRIVFKRREDSQTNTVVNRVFYQVEFRTIEAIEDLENMMIYLKEAFPIIKSSKTNLELLNGSPEKSTKLEKKVENNHDNQMDVEDKNQEVKKFINELKLSIQNGDVEMAAQWSKRLARLKIGLHISMQNTQTTNETSPDENKESVVDAKEVQSHEDSKKKLVRVVLRKSFDDMDHESDHFEINLDVVSTNIGQLKTIIQEKTKFSIDKQLIIVNDCASVNDNELLSIYKEPSLKRKKGTNQHANGFASANAQKYDDYLYEIVVIDKDSTSNTNDDEIDDKNRKRQKTELNELKAVSYTELAALYNQDLTENTEIFACDICLDDEIQPKQGVILKECMHSFCKECLRNHINNCDDPIVKCPFRREYACEYAMQEREIRALLNENEYKKFHMKSLRMSEATMKNTFHCLTPDCIGFCVHEDNLNFFDCPVCEKVNCLRCNAIHMAKTCKEYQDDLKINANNDKNAKKDQAALEKLVKNNKAMYCPGCKVIVCKQGGCDWIQCAMCKIDICWATRGPRWGPKGIGDTSGGCKCDMAQGKPCHPHCQNCH